MFEYRVDAFAPPPPSGCSGSEKGWDAARCEQYAAFLNGYAQKGWKLHSSSYRSVSSGIGCLKQSGVWLVCVFERLVS
jgi:hypothetical protein